MAKNALQIIGTAYRATLEEQDDTIVWLTHAMRGAGAELDVVLRGNAVNYAVPNQDASGLEFGGKKQTHPPQLSEDLQGLMGKGVKVYVVREDLEQRGIDSGKLIGGLEVISRSEAPKLFEKYAFIWSW